MSPDRRRHQFAGTPWHSTADVETRYHGMAVALVVDELPLFARYVVGAQVAATGRTESQPKEASSRVCAKAARRRAEWSGAEYKDDSRRS
jgi:hypothetical protein